MASARSRLVQKSTQRLQEDEEHWPRRIHQRLSHQVDRDLPQLKLCPEQRSLTGSYLTDPKYDVHASLNGARVGEGRKCLASRPPPQKGLTMWSEYQPCKGNGVHDLGQTWLPGHVEVRQLSRQRDCKACDVRG